jgi:stage V sporulation protein AB
MWEVQILLVLIGLSAGFAAGAGLFSFIIGLGIVSDFADRTHTGNCVMFYEDCIAVGGSLGAIFYIYQISVPYGAWIVPVFGLFGGIFVGCWAMALTEILNLFPIFIRRAKVIRCIPYMILGIALGKGLGALLFFYQRW